MFDMSDADLSPLKMFSTSQSAYFDPQPTISLADTDLLAGPESDDMSDRASSPSPSQQSVADDRKPTKKRKSWGQELPIPKTNLPPRKRAKTEDEKEQRRIERVLRNRAAAQSSRERKRQEVEKLEGEKKTIEQENLVLRQRVLQVEQEKWKLQQQLSAVTARLGGSISIENITPPPVSSPAMAGEMYNIKTEPTEHGIPSPEQSRQGTLAPGSISDGHRSRSASLQADLTPSRYRHHHNHHHQVPHHQQAQQMMVHAPSHHAPSPLDLTHRPAVSVADGNEHDARNHAVTDNLPDHGVMSETSNENKSNDDTIDTIDTAFADAINVDDQAADEASKQDAVDSITPALTSEQERETTLAAFDALISALSPPVSNLTNVTPSPEAPSLSFFEESYSAGSPSEDLPSPDFGAFGGDFDFNLDFSSLNGKTENKSGEEQGLMFGPLGDELIDFDSLAPSADFSAA